jgi:hypothetical protein
MKQKFALAMMLALCGLLSSCKKPISGQVFVVTEAGLNIPLGAVEIEVVNGKDAANYLNQRQTEIESKTRSLQNAYNEAKTNFDTASQVKSQTQAAVKTAENGQSWTNDTQYIALSNENEKDRRTINNLFTAYIAGTSYGFGPPMPNNAGYRNYVEAEKQTQSLQKRVSEITSECGVIRKQFLTPFQQADSKAFATLEQAQAKLGDA